MKKVIIISVIVIAVLGLGIVLFLQDAKNNKQAENDSSLPQQGQAYDNLGQEHIEIGAQHKPYNSNPPTSGPHYVQPANWGIYDKELPDEQLVHNLEHGGIWISYKDLDQATIEQLQLIQKSNSGSVVVTPRAADDTKITIASWTRLEKLDGYDEQKILDFIAANKNKSPEPLAR